MNTETALIWGISAILKGCYLALICRDHWRHLHCPALLHGVSSCWYVKKSSWIFCKTAKEMKKEMIAMQWSRKHCWCTYMAQDFLSGTSVVHGEGSRSCLRCCSSIMCHRVSQASKPGWTIGTEIFTAKNSSTFPRFYCTRQKLTLSKGQGLSWTDMRINKILYMRLTTSSQRKLYDHYYLCDTRCSHTNIRTPNDTFLGKIIPSFGTSQLNAPQYALFLGSIARGGKTGLEPRTA